MGDAKDRSPKKIQSVIWIWKWEMRNGAHHLQRSNLDPRVSNDFQPQLQPWERGCQRS